jgi:HupE / UreJ protein
MCRPHIRPSPSRVEEDMRTGIALTVFLLPLLPGLMRPAEAHEIGKTQVTVSIVDGHYAVDVVVDPDSLLMKLSAVHPAADAAQRQPGRIERDRQIAAAGSVFLEYFRIAFDGTPSTPHFEYRPAGALGDLAQAPSIVRLSGDVPPAAEKVSVKYGLALGAYALNVRVGNAEPRIVWVTGADESPAVSLIPPPPSTWTGVARQYLALGFSHIVPKGTDHILFVLGIFLLGRRWGWVLAQVSTFTIAHSITLGLTMYGVVSLPAKAVEPLIALSIVYVAIENLFTAELKPWRLALVFSFGLLHGMGFAGVLRDLGLPHGQFLTALVAFNGGVEAGQLFVIGMAASLVAYWRSRPTLYRAVVVRPASFLIAAIGLFWTIERML